MVGWVGVVTTMALQASAKKAQKTQCAILPV